MNKELTIEEGNKLIAEFMGYESKDQPWRKPLDTTAYKINDRWFPSFSLLYNQHWDWLVPAWRKFYKECCEYIYGDSHHYLLEQFDIWVGNFHSAVDANSPADGCRMLVLALNWYNSH